MGAINIKTALVQTVLRFRPGDKSFSKRMKAKFTDAYMCHSASMRSLTHWFLAEGPGLLKIILPPSDSCEYGFAKKDIWKVC